MLSRTLERIYKAGKESFNARGKIDFFWEEGLTRLSGVGPRTVPFASSNFPY